VVRVVRPSSTRSVVAVAAQCCTHPYHAVPNHHLADMLANARKPADTHRYLTTATKTMRLVLNARFLWRSGVCAGRRLSRINSAGYKMFAAAMSADTSFAVDRTSVASLAIAQENVKMRTVKLASSLAVSQRRLVGTQTKTCVMRPSPVRRKSRARARYLSLAIAKRRSKR
jgi:hypothetical protein